MESRALTIRQLNQAIDLYADGTPALHIARDFNVHEVTICNALRSAGIKLKRGRPTSYDALEAYDRRVREDAICGSNQLLLAIQRAGLRP